MKFLNFWQPDKRKAILETTQVDVVLVNIIGHLLLYHTDQNWAGNTGDGSAQTKSLIKKIAVK